MEVSQTPPQLDVVVPVHNEAHVLARQIHLLHEHLSASGLRFAITIADNASTDATLEIAQALARDLPGVRVLHLAAKGRGRALRAGWGSSHADVLAYMDVDLSTDLGALADLVAPLLEGHGDLAIGSRLAPGAQVTRGLRREVISRAYNILLRLTLQVDFSDAQCGFKAGRREVIERLLPLILDEAWFFDTELLYLARRNAFAIHEVPVHWVDDPDSRVRILRTAWEDLRGIARLRRSERTATHGRTAARTATA